MEIQAKVTAIGAQALTTADPMVILFDASASESIKKVAVIQQFADVKAKAQLDLHRGDQIVIGQQAYQIKKVGQLVNENLRTIGHVTLIFSKQDTNDLQSAVLLTPEVKPQFSIGTTITYQQSSRK